MGSRVEAGRRRLGGNAPTLALLVDWLEDEYQNAVTRGAVDAALERGINLQCFCGGVLDAPGANGIQRNRIFELASPTELDGVMLMAGTLGNHAGPQRVAEYCKRFGSLPQVSIGVKLEGMPAILVDNDSGMRDAIEHLIGAHGKKRIFFLRGPKLNAEAQSRFAVYERVLEEHGIERDPKLQAEGDFQPDSGYRAIMAALDAGAGFDAVVAANDSMAIGALHALQERRVKVPGDVALVGFDDVEEAKFLDPPLSSVEQPLYEQGKHAVRSLVARLQGQVASEDIVLRTTFVARGSCGCSDSHSPGLERVDDAQFGFEATLVRRRELVLVQMLRAARATFGGLRSGWEATLFSSLLDDVRGVSRSAFHRALTETLQHAFQNGNPISSWHDVVDTLRHCFLDSLGGDPTRQAHAEGVFHDAHLAIATLAERAQARRRIDAEHMSRQMARTGAALIATFEEGALYQACSTHLPAMGVHSAYLAMYTEGAPNTARLVYANTGDRKMIDAGSYQTNALLPDDYLPPKQPYALIVEPLYFHEHDMGFAVFGYGPKNGMVYESLRDQISAALYGARLAKP